MKSNIKNDLSQQYNKGVVIIHWVTALLILILFPMGKYMEKLPIAEKMNLIIIHAVLGIIVLLLTLVRSWLFFKKERPEHLKTGSVFNDKLAVLVHNVFYILLYVIPLSGIAAIVAGGYAEALQTDGLMVIKNNDIVALKAHGTVSFIMMLLLVVHVIGFVKHLIISRENTIKRIS